MRVERHKQATPSRSFGDRLDDRASQDFVNHKHTGRALVIAAPRLQADLPPPPRNAEFLAHLIATRDQAPQTRERRRAEPAEAIAAYRLVKQITA